MFRLHRLLDHTYQLLAQLLQIDLVTQGRTKGGQRPGGIIFATIKAMVDDLLNAAT